MSSTCFPLYIDIVTNLGPPAHLSIFLPPPGTLVRMHRAYLVRLTEVYGHLIWILHSFRSRFTTMDAQTSVTRSYFISSQLHSITATQIDNSVMPQIALLHTALDRQKLSHKLL